MLLATSSVRAETKRVVGLSTEADGKELWHHEIVKTLNAELGTTPQNLILVFDHCFSGGAIPVAMDTLVGLKAPLWSVATSSKDATQPSKTMRFKNGAASPNQNVPSLTDTNDNTLAYDGFGPQRIRSMRSDVTKSVKGAYTDATKGVYGPNSGDPTRRGKEDPQYKSIPGSEAKADATTLSSGTSSNHAILFFGDDDGERLADLSLIRELNNRLRDKYNYPKAAIQLLLNNYDTVGGFQDNPTFSHATKSNFETAVHNLKGDAHQPTGAAGEASRRTERASVGAGAWAGGGIRR
jgi:hypothetical protein